MQNMKRSFEDRFWANIESMPENDCWLWKGTVASGDYGNIRFNGRTIGAHQASWLIHYGPIPTNMHILHRCDTPACVRPTHLFLGTQSDNMRDRDAKGRTVGAPPGERNTQAKLKSSDIPKIISLYNRGVSLSKTAMMFGIGQTAVFNIVHRKTWRNVDTDYRACSQQERSENPRTILRMADIKEMRDQRLTGKTYECIAKTFGVSTTTAYRTILGRSRSRVKC